jgi:hypothetical protein
MVVELIFDDEAPEMSVQGASVGTIGAYNTSKSVRGGGFRMKSPKKKV